MPQVLSVPALAKLPNSKAESDYILRSTWDIQSDDIDKTYNQARLSNGHPLRKASVNALAPAWGKLCDKIKERLYKLASDVPEFCADIEAPWG